MAAPENERKTFTLIESSNLHTGESLMRVYKDPRQALCDLVDNAVDDRIEGEPLTISVSITRNSINIYNRGGMGLGFEGLEKFMTWGYSDKQGQGKIGQYGVGGKAAMGFLGRSIEIRCSPKGSNTEYVLSDPDWDKKGGLAQKEHTGIERTTEIDEGFFGVRISNLKKNVSVSETMARLGDTYRSLILDGSVAITVNGQEVKPLEWRYMESDPELAPRKLLVETGFNDQLVLTLGVLEQGQSVSPGIRCEYHGRLIEHNFFGYEPSQIPQLNRLIGEISLNHLEVMTNKTGFVEDFRWQETKDVLHRAMEDLVKRLPSLQIERAQISKSEQMLVRDAKRVLDKILASNRLLPQDQLGGESSRRVSGKPWEEASKEPKSERPKDKEKTANSDKAPNFRRWGALHSWEVVSLGSKDIKANIIEQDGQPSLLINADFPLYRVALLTNQQALELYMVDTAIQELCKRGKTDLSIDEYLVLVHKLENQVGAYYTREKDQIQRKKK